MQKFKLYIAGYSSKTSQKVIDRVVALLSDCVKDYSLSIIDVTEDPDTARENTIFATPVFVKVFPLPERRVFGSFLNEESVIRHLRIDCD